MNSTRTNIKVVVRVRPYNRREMETNQKCIIKVLDPTTLLFDPDADDDDDFFFQGTKQNYRDVTKRVHKKLSMDFDRVFDTDTKNEQIFLECTAPLIDSVLNGYNCSVFVYGATGAGKTFTMLGNDDFPGLAYLTMRHLFQKIDEQSDIRKFNIAVSYLEVYNEQVMNLLTRSGPLKLREDSTGVVVCGLMPKPINSANDLLELLTVGNANRTQHPTDANAESSRSHAVFQVHIRITDRKTDTKRTVKLSMIDLAGSERAASTKGIGLRFREGANINKSLLALGNCINKLADGLKHIPYRDSNLTRILKDSLGGNCQTLMVANVSMSSLTYEDTYNTLKYASRAKKIRTTLRQNALKTNMPKDFYIKKVEELMTENSRLTESLAASVAMNKVLQTTSSSSSSSSHTYDDIELKNWYRKIDAVNSSVIKFQEYVLGIQSKVKIMSSNIKFKQYAEEFCKLLVLNRPISTLDIDKFTTSLNHIKKQIEEQKKEHNQWRRKYLDARTDLDKLRKEIQSSKYADLLQVYQKNKDLQILHTKQNIQINYLCELNSLFMNEWKKLRQLVSLLSEALQKYYQKYGELNELQHNFIELQRILRLNVTLLNGLACVADSTTKSDSDESDLEDYNAFQNGKSAQSTESERSVNNFSTSSSNRHINLPNHLDFETDFNLETEAEDSAFTQSDAQSSIDMTFKIPAAKKPRIQNLNETHILSTNDWIKPFELPAVNSASTIIEEKGRNSKKTYVNNILSEKIIQPVQNKKYMENVLLKSQNFDHRGILKTVTMGLQKENQKHSPNAIRKSPRALATKSIASTSNVIKKRAPISIRKEVQTVRGTTTANAPTVRINRAASFRVKK